MPVWAGPQAHAGYVRNTQISGLQTVFHQFPSVSLAHQEQLVDQPCRSKVVLCDVDRSRAIRIMVTDP